MLAIIAEVIGAKAKEGATRVRDKHGYFPFEYLVENHNITTMDNIYWILEGERN